MDTPGCDAAGRCRRVAPSRVGLVVAVAVITTAMGACADLQQPEVEQVAAAFTRSGADDVFGIVSCC